VNFSTITMMLICAAVSLSVYLVKQKGGAKA